MKIPLNQDDAKKALADMIVKETRRWDWAHGCLGAFLKIYKSIVYIC